MLKFTLAFLFIVTASTAVAQKKGANPPPSTGAGAFRFPDPQISISTEPPSSDQEVYDRIKLFASQYTTEFIEQFLLMNGLRENLFNLPQVLESVHRTIESQPVRDLKKPEVIKKNYLELRTSLISLSNRLYAKNLPNTKYYTTSNNRIDSLESKVNDLLIINKQYGDILRQIEELNQKVTALQQKQPAAAIAPVAPSGGSSAKLSFAALILAAASFFFQLYRKR